MTEPPNSSSSSVDTGPPSSGSLLSAAQALLAHQLQATFLPSGFPKTVAPGYLPYVWWQAAHHCASAVNGVLASTFLLYALGLGEGAIPTAGALSWVLKDGLGQLGTLLFGRAIAHSFDVDARRWYVLASAKLQLAVGLELCTFVLPHLFLPLASAANALKGLAWMAGGSSRSAFNVAFAVDNNIGDVTAKATSQTICTSLLGTAAGMALAAAVGQDAGAAAAAYAAVAGAHLWTSKCSVHIVPLATLNASRLRLLLARFMLRQQGLEQPQRGKQQGAAYGAGAEQRPAELCSPLPTPAQLAAEEPLFSSPVVLVGASLQRLDEEQGRQLAAVLSLYSTRRHVLLPVPGRPRQALLLLHEGAEAGDCLLAFLHAWLLLEAGQPVGNGAEARAALQRADALLPALQQELAAAGWEVGKVALESRRRRITWQQSLE